MSETIRVLIVDDQDVVRFGVRAMLNTADDIEIVGEADNGASAVSEARKLTPDVVLMDLSMPEVDGVSAARRLLQEPQPPRVLMLTTFDFDRHVLAALKAGAMGYLVKGSGMQEMLSAIRTVHSGGMAISPAAMSKLLASPGTSRQHRSQEQVEQAARRIAKLSQRDRELLTLIAEGASNEDIARKMHFSLSTVKNYVSKLLTKLEVNNRTQAAILVHEANRAEQGSSTPHSEH